MANRRIPPPEHSSGGGITTKTEWVAHIRSECGRVDKVGFLAHTPSTVQMREVRDTAVAITRNNNVTVNGLNT